MTQSRRQARGDCAGRGEEALGQVHCKCEGAASPLSPDRPPSPPPEQPRVEAVF